jgi:hypothetical protein
MTQTTNIITIARNNIFEHLIRIARSNTINHLTNLLKDKPKLNKEDVIGLYEKYLNDLGEVNLITIEEAVDGLGGRYILDSLKTGDRDFMDGTFPAVRNMLIDVLFMSLDDAKQFIRETLNKYRQYDLVFCFLVWRAVMCWRAMKEMAYGLCPHFVVPRFMDLDLSPIALKDLYDGEMSSEVMYKANVYCRNILFRGFDEFQHIHQSKPSMIQLQAERETSTFSRGELSVSNAVYHTLLGVWLVVESVRILYPEWVSDAESNDIPLYWRECTVRYKSSLAHLEIMRELIFNI